MIIQEINATVNGNSLSGEVIVPSPVLTSTKQAENGDLTKSPNFQLKLTGVTPEMNIIDTVQVEFTNGDFNYTANMTVINSQQNGTVTLQYVDGLTVEEAEPEPTGPYFSSPVDGATINGTIDSELGEFRWPIEVVGSDGNIISNDVTSMCVTIDGNDWGVGSIEDYDEATSSTIITEVFIACSQAATGTATLTYDDSDTGETCTATFTYDISEGGSEPDIYHISAGNITNATVTFDKEEATEGETIALTVTPDSGYILNTLDVVGNITGTIIDVDILSVSRGEYSFIMPAEDVIVNVECILDEPADSFAFEQARYECSAVYNGTTTEYTDATVVFLVNGVATSLSPSDVSISGISSSLAQYMALDGGAYGFRCTAESNISTSVTVTATYNGMTATTRLVLQRSENIPDEPSVDPVLSQSINNILGSNYDVVNDMSEEDALAAANNILYGDEEPPV